MRAEFRPYAFLKALICCLVLQSLLTGASGQTREKVNVGALHFSFTGPLFLAKAHHYFEDENLDVGIVFFEAAPTIATTVASSDLTFDVTALSAALFNLAASGQIKIIAGQAREEKGHPGNMILVTKAEFETGVNRIELLFDKPFGLTQIGSPSHYQLGQLARMHGEPLRSAPVQPFQALPNLVAALNGNRVSGHVVRLANYADYGSFQFGAVFATESTLQHRSDTVPGHRAGSPINQDACP
jgi:NitT/TauT family transport system substrate-binding protein